MDQQQSNSDSPVAEQPAATTDSSPGTEQASTDAAVSSVLDAVADGASAESPETKPEDQKPAEYSAFEIPAGIDENSEDFKALIEEAKALGLSQANAQRYLNNEAARRQQVTNMASTAALVWREQAAKDKEIGGDKFKENLSVAGLAMDAYGTKELSALLKNTHLINHPEILRFFVRAGKPLRESSMAGQSVKPGSTQTKSMAERMYKSADH